MNIFNRAVPMSIFTWDGELDTIISPLDSIKYYNYILHSGLISIEPNSGHIKAWVGGINHKQFKLSPLKLKKYLKNCKFIIDHEGAWQNYNIADKYYLTGASGWL